MLRNHQILPRTFERYQAICLQTIRNHFVDICLFHTIWGAEHCGHILWMVQHHIHVSAQPKRYRTAIFGEKLPQSDENF